MKIVFSFFLLIISILVNAQYNISEKFILPDEVEETSGLIFFNNHLITHNDSGGLAELYEIDTISGSITRTVTIQNASNVDWEDICQDQNYIYIGDFGNNNGDRTDLSIYRISKYDYEHYSTVIADTISYSYAEQVDFTAQHNATNWDAEALVSIGDQLLIFSKNWEDNHVNIYPVPKNPGTYTTSSQSVYNVQGMITGADQIGDSLIVLVGYDSGLHSCIVTIRDIDLDNLDLFGSSSVTQYNEIVSAGNQLEGICFVSVNNSDYRLFLSNERFSFSTLVWDAKLRVLELDKTVLSIQNIKDDNLVVYPNPSNGKVNFTFNEQNFSRKKIYVYNSSGIELSELMNPSQNFVLDFSKYGKGIYEVVIQNSTTIITRRIIIN